MLHLYSLIGIRVILGVLTLLVLYQDVFELTKFVKTENINEWSLRIQNLI